MSYLSSNVLFLGAGASNPWGLPLMSEFFQLVKQNIGSANIDAFSLFEKNNITDLEDILELINAHSASHVIRMELEPPIKGAIQFVGNDIYYKEDDIYHRLGNPTTFLSGLHRLKRYLERQIFISLRKYDRDRAFQSLQRISSKICINKKLTIFTTNYDLVIEDLCREMKWILTDGFAVETGDPSHTLLWDSKKYVHVENQNPSIVLFKLHGSINWRRIEDGIIKATDVIPPPIYHDPEQPEHILIYPARRKVASEDPFFSCYNALQRTLDEANLCVFIGYSFRDYDCLNRIQSSLLHNKNLRILICDLRATDLKDEFFGINDRVLCFEGAFGMDDAWFDGFKEKLEEIS